MTLSPGLNPSLRPQSLSQSQAPGLPRVTGHSLTGALHQARTAVKEEPFTLTSESIIPGIPALLRSHCINSSHQSDFILSDSQYCLFIVYVTDLINLIGLIPTPILV